MTNNIINFFHGLNSFIYDVKHVSISQWDVENFVQPEDIHNNSQRQLR